MILFIESIFVGIYCYIIYNTINIFTIKNIYYKIFIIGFIKHFLGYYLGLHNYYCSYDCNNSNSIAISNYLITDSIGEGFLFLFLYTLIKFNKNNIIFVGIFIHLLFEILGFHKLFCKYRCINININIDV